MFFNNGLDELPNVVVSVWMSDYTREKYGM